MLVKFESAIPCYKQNLSLMGSDEDWHPCDSGWEGECSKKCPSYRPAKVEICKRHHREFVGECDECFGEYWENLARRDKRIDRRRQFLKNKLHLKLEYGCFDRFDAWVLNLRPKLVFDFIPDSNGKKAYRGIQVTALRRCFQVGIYFRL